MNILETATAIANHRALNGLPAGNAIVSYSALTPPLKAALTAAGAVRLGSVSYHTNKDGKIIREVTEVYESPVNYFALPVAKPVYEKDGHLIRSFYSNAVYVAPVDIREIIASVVGNNIPTHVEEPARKIERDRDETGLYRRFEKIASIAGFQTFKFVTLDGKRYCFFTVPGNADYDTEVFEKDELAKIDRTRLWRVNIVVGVIFDAKRNIETKLSCLAPAVDGAFFLIRLDTPSEEDFFASLLGNATEHHHEVTHFVLNGDWRIQNFARWEWLSVVSKMVERRDENVILIEQPDGYVKNPYLSPEDILQFFGKDIAFGNDGIIARFDDEKHVKDLRSDTVSVTPMFVTKVKRYDRIERKSVKQPMDVFVYNDAFGEPSNFYLVQGLSETAIAIMARRLPVPTMPFQKNKLQYVDYLRAWELKSLQEFPADDDEWSALKSKLNKVIEDDDFRYLKLA
ncbi:hypothetical protein [Agrobacterium rosae]|uniref:Uncharacterized protein n=1 Tax=Agrobacterium rosae TaxID=1972867 RepID=A0A1R3TJ10_9HYPH|nr:hypothetical protein [Agrobacterium rosae]SCX19762.1 hypothetical protein DSM25559_1891 [Agrobacterium rosae]